jgi:hypothetical protein
MAERTTDWRIVPALGGHFSIIGKLGAAEVSVATVHSRDDAGLILSAPNLLAALEEIANGCLNLHPAHVDKHKNRTKAEIEAIARAALQNARGPSEEAA